MPTTDFETFAEWLKHYRKIQRYSMRGLGKAVGVSGSYISTIESNNDPPGEMSPRPSKSLVKKIATVFGYDEDEALRLAGHKKSNTPPIRFIDQQESRPAILLIRELAARYGDAKKLGPKQIQEISEDLEEIATVRIKRLMLKDMGQERQAA